MLSSKHPVIHCREAYTGPAWMVRLTCSKQRAIPQVFAHEQHSCCRFSGRFTPTLSGIARGEQRQITLSVNDLQISCRTSYSSSVA